MDKMSVTNHIDCFMINHYSDTDICIKKIRSVNQAFSDFFSFPFNVKLGDIFGFGQVGVHWRILRYDGLGLAQEGFFAERTSNWVMLDDTENILNASLTTLYSGVKTLLFA